MKNGKTSPSEAEILHFFKQKPRATGRDLSHHFGISLTVARNRVSRLKKQGKLISHWIVPQQEREGGEHALIIRRAKKETPQNLESDLPALLKTETGALRLTNIWIVFGRIEGRESRQGQSAQGRVEPRTGVRENDIMIHICGDDRAVLLLTHEIRTLRGVESIAVLKLLPMDKITTA